MKTRVGGWVIAVVLVGNVSVQAVSSADEFAEVVKQRKAAQVEFQKKAEKLVAQMTLKEKLGLYKMSSSPVGRLGVDKYDWWNEALHGVARNGLSTQFPQSISMATTWDPELIQQMGEAIGKEARARHHEKPGRNGRYQGLTIWSPTINLARDPRWGRNEETYGEDPLLSGEMAKAFVKGLQGYDPKYLQTVATVKHFIANNTEHNRYSYRPTISERDLREHYMPAFRAAVEEADVQSIMSAYNGINDVPCAANKWLLTDVLRGEWGFHGTVVTDVGCPDKLIKNHKFVKDRTEALAAMVNAGVNVACPLKTNEKEAEQAINAGLMTEARLDRAIIQNLTTRMQLGQMVDDADNPYKKIPVSVIGCDEHLGIAREIAQKGAVLLKNDAVDGATVLPLNAGKIKKIILAGPYANAAFLGHYSGTPTHRAVTPLEGLKAAGADVQIDVHPFVGDEAQAIPASVLQPPEGEDATSGLKGEYFRKNDLSGEAEVVRIDRNIDFTWKKPISNVDPLIPGTKFGVRWTGRLVPDISGEYRLAIKTGTRMRVWLDEKLLIDAWDAKGEARMESDAIHLEAGKSHALKVEFASDGKYKAEAYLGWKLPEGYDADFFAPGFADDSDSTLVVYVGGFNPAMSGEWSDKDELAMPSDQRQDLERWVKRYKNMALVLNGGTIIVEPWLFDNIPAVMHTWYAGQEGGYALADFVFGKVSPSGRLPLTWYASQQDIPELDDYAIHTGRTYMYNENPVQFPFGHGLSYTTFKYGSVNVSKSTIAPGETVTVEVPVRNIGNMEAEEVVQVYAGNIDSAVYQPKIKLVAFGRIDLKPGDTGVLKLEVPADRLTYWDVKSRSFVLEAGGFELQIGSSSEDIRQTVKIEALN